MSTAEITVAIGSEFLTAFARLPLQQSKVSRFLEKFRHNPRASGIHYEKIREAGDPNLYLYGSIRHTGHCPEAGTRPCVSTAVGGPS